ncbi:MAG: hypothetical protein QOF57_1294 [Frankiaceae bacterium]|nr:hypothetical protein [Frankiaceae bacterium]
MTSATLTRHRNAPATPDARGSVVLAGLAAAAWVIALAWAAIVGLAILAWSTAGSTASAAAAARLGSQLWLLVHHVQLHLHGGGSVTFVPLGLTAGVVALMYRGGIVAARSSGARTLPDCWRTAGAIALPYATVAVVVAGASRTDGVQASVWQAAVFPGVLAGAVAWVAAVRHIGAQTRAVARVPVVVRALARGVARLSVLWVAAATALLAIAATFGAERVQGLITAADAGTVGGAVLTLATIVVVPNGVVWAGSYALGGGVGVGAAAVSPFHIVGGALPALPPLAVLPQSPPVAALRLLILALPVLTLVVAVRVERSVSHAGEPWWHPFARLGGLALGTSVVLMLLSDAASGSVGPLALGPHPLRDGALALAATGAACLLVASLRTWQRYDARCARVVAAVAQRGRAVGAGVRLRLTGH